MYTPAHSPPPLQPGVFCKLDSPPAASNCAGVFAWMLSACTGSGAAGSGAALAVLGNVIALTADDVASPSTAAPSASVVAAWARLVAHATAPSSKSSAAVRFHPLYQWAGTSSSIDAVDDDALPAVVAQIRRLWARDVVVAILRPGAVALPAGASLYLAVLAAFPAVARDVRSALAFEPTVVPALWRALQHPPLSPDARDPLADARTPVLRLFAITATYLYQYVPSTALAGSQVLRARGWSC